MCLGTFEIAVDIFLASRLKFIANRIRSHGSVRKIAENPCDIRILQLRNDLPTNYHDYSITNVYTSR